MSAAGVATYELLPPRTPPPEESLVPLRAWAAERHDVAALWWVTALLRDGHGGEVIREELHVELVAPLDDLDPRDDQTLNGLYGEFTRGGIGGAMRPTNLWCIPPLRILPAVRAVGTRIA
ncbi:MAG TPA: hypothetical protein VHD91_02415 [Gaiellaceae bacterium]|nr:hypothetical protein [Gaiellaceae bacterium]